MAGDVSSRGAAPAIIAAPATLNEDVAFNLGQQGFDERQCVLLLTPLEVDDGFVPAGTVVSSHMIFMNQEDGTPGGTDHTGVEWTFDAAILGVMSDTVGNLEAAGPPILGAPGSVYGAPYGNRGLEGNDSYSFAGNVLTLNSHITQPGRLDPGCHGGEMRSGGNGVWYRRPEFFVSDHRRPKNPQVTEKKQLEPRTTRKQNRRTRFSIRLLLLPRIWRIPRFEPPDSG